MEIIEYLDWREECFRNNPHVDLMIYEDDKGLSISRPMKSEASVGNYIHLKYGIIF